MLFRKVMLGLALVPFFCPIAFAAIGKPPMRYGLLFNYDIRHSDENFYANRLEAFFIKKINPGDDKKMSLEAVPFVEVRHSVERRKRERLAAGAEFGFRLNDSLYLGQQLRQVWRSEPVYNRGVIKNINMLEAVSIVTLSCRLIPGKPRSKPLSSERLPSSFERGKDILKGYISGEYTYDFRLGRGTRIESMAGLLVPIAKEAELNLDWRHRDRIHADDCDTIEASVSYLF